MLTQGALRTIEEILKRGNTVEIRKRKNEIVIFEVAGKQRYVVTVDGR